MKKAFLTAAICQCCLALSAQAARLNITRIGEGALNPDVGVHSYFWGKQITVTATPAEGWMVDHWEGDITGTGSSKTLYLFGDKRATVVFLPQVATPANALVRYVGQSDNNYGWSLFFVPQPVQGWSAFLVELDFGDGIILSTEVRITPDTLPFEGQACR